jgi:hypothetical protein
MSTNGIADEPITLMDGAHFQRNCVHGNHFAEHAAAHGISNYTTNPPRTNARPRGYHCGQGWM